MTKDTKMVRYSLCACFFLTSFPSLLYADKWKHEWMCNLWWKNYVANKIWWMTKMHAAVYVYALWIAVCCVWLGFCLQGQVEACHFFSSFVCNYIHISSKFKGPCLHANRRLVLNVQQIEFFLWGKRGSKLYCITCFNLWKRNDDNSYKMNESKELQIWLTLNS